MRIVRELTQGEVRISVFHWNNKFLLKFERGRLEMTFKVPEYDIAGEEWLIRLATGELLQKCIGHFDRLEADWNQALESE